ncbi:MAG: twin-arginine translocase TatA/TatE family subunit [Faecalibacterium prausnitzii]
MKIGFWELIVIVIVAFVFIGPDQLPVYAKKIGKMLRELKKYTGAASEEIQKNVVEPLNEIQAPLKEAVAPPDRYQEGYRQRMRDVTKSFTGIGKTSKEEAAKKQAEAEEVTDLTEDTVEELPEQPAEAPADTAETVEAPAEKPEQPAAEAAQPAAEPVAEPVQEAPAAAEAAAEAAPAEEAKV